MEFYVGFHFLVVIHNLGERVLKQLSTTCLQIIVILFNTR